MTIFGRALAAAVSLISFAAGVYGSAETVRFPEVKGLSLAIERGERLSSGRAQSIVSDNALADASRRCGLTGRASVSVHLAVLDALAQDVRGTSLMTARAAVETALRCSPLDGNLWLRRAMVLAADNDSSESIISLRHSARVAPAEGWIVATRVLFTQNLIGRGLRQAEDDYRRDARTILLYGQDQVVMQIYSTAAQDARVILREAAAIAPPSRRERLERLFDEADAAPS